MIKLSTYNLIANIKKIINNIFGYSTDDGITWKKIDLNVGSHEIEDINNKIER